MSKLTQEGIVTPIGSVTPDFLSQHYIDTVANKAYVSFGLTNSSWQEIGGGGGGSGGVVGVINSIVEIKALVDDGSLQSWNIDTGGPLFLRIGKLSSYDINIGLENAIASTNTVHNKLYLFISTPNVGTDITITIAGNNNEVFLDPNAGTSSSSSSIVTNNRILIYDVVYTDLDIEFPNAGSKTIILNKLSDTAYTVGSGL